jgi:hypothetical protein
MEYPPKCVLLLLAGDSNFVSVTNNDNSAMKKLTILFFVFHFSFFTFHLSKAQIIHVPAEYPTIQAAVDAAGYGDTILVAPGTYLENIRIQGNNKIVTLASNFIFSADTNDINNTIIDASQPQNPNYGMGILLKNMDSTLMPRITGFTITGGTGYYKTYGGGIYSSKAVPVISYNHIYDCSVTGTTPMGAGIYVGTGYSVKVCMIEHNVIQNCSITASASTVIQFGAGICITEVNAIIEENEISHNIMLGNITEQGGGGTGICCFYAPPIPYSWQVTIQNNDVMYNEFENKFAHGAGILLDRDYGVAQFIVTGNNISFNECRSIGTNGISAGAAIFVWNPSAGLVISNNIISNNNVNVGPSSSQKFGGGICIQKVDSLSIESVPLIEKNYIMNNSAQYGAGMNIIGEGVKMVNNFISGNQAELSGGAVYFQGMVDDTIPAEMINNTITYNFASGQGGGMMISGEMNILLMNNVLYGNQAEASSGELSNNSNGTARIHYCDINTDEITGLWSGDFNFYADPGFINDTCKIAEFSPCEDKGADSIFVDGAWYNAPVTDIEETPRPWHMGIDVGADECDIITRLPEKLSNTNLITIESYPNPTGGIVNLQFTLYNLQSIILKIYNAQGQEVAVVLNEKLTAGEHTVRWNAEGLPSGIYFYRLTTNDQRTATGKLVIK